MATEPETDGLDWFDPLAERPQRFVWEDGVHIVKRIDMVPYGIAYTLKCGPMFSFMVPSKNGVVQEAKIKQPKTNCPECLSSKSRSRAR